MDTVTGLFLKSYMTIAKLMAFIDKKRKRTTPIKLPGSMSEVKKKVSLKEA